MTEQEIKEQLIKLQGFADGLKNGAEIFAKYVIDRLALEKNENKEESQK